MHIVHILTRLLRAGSEENILLTSAGQIAEGDKVTLIYGGHSKTDLAKRIAPEAKLLEIPSLVRPLNPVRDAKAFFDIYHALKDLSPDVVHTHQSKAGVIGRLAAAAAGVPCIVHGVHILPFMGVGRGKSVIYLLVERLVARVTHGYIHVSEGMRDACLNHGIGLDVPHEVVFSGFDLARFRDRRIAKDAKNILRCSHGKVKPIVLSMLAALEPRKQHLELLEALAPTLRERPNVRLIFAGEGELYPKIEGRVESLGLSAQVVLLGFRDDPERIIAMSDICLLCSGQEGLPRSVLQYVAARKPVVMFDLPGVEVAVLHDKNALVIPAGDWSTYCESVFKLIDDVQLRARLSEGSGSVDLSRWDWPGMGEGTTRFYRKVMEVQQFHTT